MNIQKKTLNGLVTITGKKVINQVFKHPQGPIIPIIRKQPVYTTFI